MKLLTVLILMSAFACSLFALVPDDEQIELRYMPSFRDGTLVWLVRSSNGKTRCMVYRLRVVIDGHDVSHSKGPSDVIREVAVTVEQFEALAKAIESSGLRREAERHSGATDGEAWIFRHKLGARMLQYQFTSPKESSEAYRLGMQFVRSAKLDSLEPPKK
jgi:hypothetical protein